MKDLFLRVPYVLVWDGNFEVCTHAKYNIQTCEVTDVESVDSSEKLNNCEREYIVLNDEQIEVSFDDSDRCFANIVNELMSECTDNYIDHRIVMADLSIATIVKAIEHIGVFLQTSSLKHEEKEDLQSDIKSDLSSFYEAIKKLRTDQPCPHCDINLYKSDLPQYDFICPYCDENF